MEAQEQREKLINAVVYFALNTENLGITKLCKLLYFLDFEHYKATGRSVTGSKYRAWKMGPVPVEFWYEFKRGMGLDLANRIIVSTTPISNGKVWKAISARSEFDASEFTKRELGLLDALARRYRKSTSDEMIEETHLEHRPWHQVYEIEKKDGAIIPYEMAVRDHEKEIIEERTRHHKEVVANFNQ